MNPGCGGHCAPVIHRTPIQSIYSLLGNFVPALKAVAPSLAPPLRLQKDLPAFYEASCFRRVGTVVTQWAPGPLVRCCASHTVQCGDCLGSRAVCTTVASALLVVAGQKYCSSEGRSTSRVSVSSSEHRTLTFHDGSDPMQSACYEGPADHLRKWSRIQALEQVSAAATLALTCGRGWLALASESPCCWAHAQASSLLPGLCHEPVEQWWVAGERGWSVSIGQVILSTWLLNFSEITLWWTFTGDTNICTFGVFFACVCDSSSDFLVRSFPVMFFLITDHPGKPLASARESCVISSLVVCPSKQGEQPGVLLSSACREDGLPLLSSRPSLRGAVMLQLSAFRRCSVSCRITLCKPVWLFSAY